VPSLRYKDLSLGNSIGRMAWQIVWVLLYRPTPRILHPWRRFLLRLFGAKLGKGAHPYPSARIWAPWNLEMGDYSCLGEQVDCYCVDKIRLGAHSLVSQYSFLCSASHDYSDLALPLVTAPISIGERAWVTSDVFIGPGVTIGKGAVVLARSSVFKSIEPWGVFAGNPAVKIKDRRVKGSSDSGEIAG